MYSLYTQVQWLRVSEDGLGYPGAVVKGSYEQPDASMVCLHVSVCMYMFISLVCLRYMYKLYVCIFLNVCIHALCLFTHVQVSTCVVCLQSCAYSGPLPRLVSMTQYNHKKNLELAFHVRAIRWATGALIFCLCHV